MSTQRAPTRRAHLRFAALLALSFAAFLALTMLGYASDQCECKCGASIFVSGFPKDREYWKWFFYAVTGRATPPQDRKPGDVILGQIGAEYVNRPNQVGPETVTISWTPPPGSTNVSFPGLQPDRQEGNTYYFDNLPVDHSGENPGTPWVDVLYELGPVPPGQNSYRAVEQMTVEFEGAHVIEGLGEPVSVSVSEGASIQVGTVTEGGGSSSTQGASQRAARRDGATAWEIDLWSQPEDAPALTTSLCEHWRSRVLDTLPSGVPFVAVRYPLVEDPDTGLSPWPTVHNGLVDPTITLETTLAAAPLYTVTLEVLPEASQWLAAYAPSDEGLGWLALGPKGGALPPCPEELHVPADVWELRAQAVVVLDGVGEAWTEPPLELYVGYLFDQPAPGWWSAWGLGTSPFLIEDDRLALAGPLEMAPRDPVVSVAGSDTARVAPGKIVTFTNSLANHSVDPQFVTVSASSTLGCDVVLYTGFSDELLVPVDGPIRLGTRAEGKGTTALVHLAVTIPEEAEGLERVSLVAVLASELDASRALANYVLIGPGATESVGLMHLPLLVR